MSEASASVNSGSSPTGNEGSPNQTLPSERNARAASESVAKSAGIASAAVFMSRITGLLREIALARIFGASAAYDAFVQGFRIPNLTRDLFAEGALSSAFVPTFVDHLSNKGKEEAERLANLVATAIILVVGGICLIGVFVAPAIVNVIAPGYHAVPGKFEMTVLLTRIMFPFLLLVALAAQAMGVLNSLGSFGIPALSSSMFNLGSLAVGIFLAQVAAPFLGIHPIEGIAWGVVFGGALQLAFQMPVLARHGFRFRPAIDFRHPGVRQIILLMGPAILGNAATQINVMVNSNFASQIVDPVRGPDGAASWLSWSFRFMQLPLGLFGVAIASATSTAVSRMAALGEMDEFRRTLSKSLAMVFLLTVPSSVGLFLLGPSIVGAIYEGGEFNVYDTRQTATALAGFSLGLAGYSALKVLVPAFYALKDSRTPMLVSLASILINLGTVWGVTHYTKLGHTGLALSTSAVAVTGSVTLFIVLKNRIGGLYGRILWASLWKVALAAAFMGAVVFFSSESIAMLLQPERVAGVTKLLSPNKIRYFVDLLISIPAGAGVYYWACRTLGVEELQLATKGLVRPFERLRSRLSR